MPPYPHYSTEFKEKQKIRIVGLKRDYPCNIDLFEQQIALTNTADKLTGRQQKKSHTDFSVWESRLYAPNGAKTQLFVTQKKYIS